MIKLFLPICFAFAISSVKVHAVNGFDLKKEDALAKHAIKLSIGKSNLCSGSLIHKRVVLTAAHCFDDSDLIYANFPFSSHKKKIKAKSLVIHKDYFIKDTDTQNYAYDIALVFLNRDAPKDYPIVKVNYSFQLDVEDKLLSLGFGGTEVEKQKVKNGYRYIAKNYGKLRGADLSVKGLDRVRNWNAPFLLDGVFNENRYIEDRNYVVFDQEMRSGLCMGDSGGPSFFISNQDGIAYQFALTSNASIADSRCNGDANLLNLAGFEEWINFNLKSF